MRYLPDHRDDALSVESLVTDRETRLCLQMDDSQLEAYLRDLEPPDWLCDSRDFD